VLNILALLTRALVGVARRLIAVSHVAIQRCYVIRASAVFSSRDALTEEPGFACPETGTGGGPWQTTLARVTPPAPRLLHASHATSVSPAVRHWACAAVPAGRAAALIGSHASPVTGTLVDVIAVEVRTIFPGPATETDHHVTSGQGTFIGLT